MLQKWRAGRFAARAALTAPAGAQLLATGKANTGWRYWTLHWRGEEVRLDTLRAELLHRWQRELEAAQDADAEPLEAG